VLKGTDRFFDQLISGERPRPLLVSRPH
jgi:hypothetical protein